MILRCKEFVKDMPEGSLYREAAELLKPGFGCIVGFLDKGSGCFRELNDLIEQDISVEPVTLKSREGRSVLERTALMMLTKALRETAGRELKGIKVDFKVSGAYYIKLQGIHADADLLARTEKAMCRYAKERLPIRKKVIGTACAKAYFSSVKREDKLRLLNYWRHSYVTLYELDGCMDDFYGPMCPDAGYVNCFSLVPYEDGFVLLLPTEEGSKLPDFDPCGKLFEVENSTSAWASDLGIENIADLNDCICRGEAAALVQMQEALFEHKIGSVADVIIKENKKFVLLAGPSSSGKTTTAHRIAIQLGARGRHPFVISADDYFLPGDRRPLDKDGKPDFESVRAVDTELFNDDMTKLLAGESVELPTFDFVSQTRKYTGKTMRLSENDVLIIEGIHCLNPAFSVRIPDRAKYRIYVSALTPLNIDDHTCIDTSDMRLVRRMIRDFRTRGYSAEATIGRWPSVRQGERENIDPYIQNADSILNSSMLYEIAVIKPYGESLLFGIKEDSDAYPEARRLLKLLDYSLAAGDDHIGGTSIVREFIGGSAIV